MIVVDKVDTPDEPMDILLGFADAKNFYIGLNIRQEVPKDHLSKSSKVSAFVEPIETVNSVDERLFAQDRRDVGRITNTCHHIRIPDNTKTNTLSPVSSVLCKERDHQTTSGRNAERWRHTALNVTMGVPGSHSKEERRGISPSQSTIVC